MLVVQLNAGLAILFLGPESPRFHPPKIFDRCSDAMSVIFHSHLYFPTEQSC